jgi:hypothetical protein
MPSPGTTINVTTNVVGPFNATLTPASGGEPYTTSPMSKEFIMTGSLDDYTLQLTNPTTNEVLSTTNIPAAVISNVYAQAVSSADTNSAGISKTPIVKGQAQSQTNVVQPNILIPPTDAEVFTAANDQYGKYFTSQDARLYIGNVFIDENIYVQYTLQDNKIPIYGYRSRFYDAMAQGKSIVQGQLGINFVSEGYLYTVLNAYKGLINPPPNSDQAALNALVYTKNQYQSQPATPELTAQLTAINMKIANSLSNSVSLAIAQSNATNLIPAFPAAKGGYNNATYLDIVFNLVIELEGAGRTVKRVIEGCQLVANDQVIDTSGNTLSDGYSFIARRLR